MSAIDPQAVREEARRWLRHAAEDERMVGLALAAQPPLAGPAAYHAQQVAEKCLKAILVLRGRAVPRTHDVAYLLSLTGNPPGLDQASAEQVASLTPWASQTRYPDLDDAGGPTADEIASALQALSRLMRVAAEMIDAPPR